MNGETCVECGGKLPTAYALTTCEKCREAFARIRVYAEANGTNAPPEQPLAPARPPVHVGEVLGILYNELTQLIREHGQLKGFEQRVVQAAKSPAAWLALREELGK